MSYIPTEWQTGDIVTAEKLNNMESGISAASASGGGLQIIEVTMSNQGVVSCGKSYNELCAYIESGKSLLFSFDFEGSGSGYGTLDQLYYSASTEGYTLAVYLDSTYYLTAESADAELRYVID